MSFTSAEFLLFLPAFAILINVFGREKLVVRNGLLLVSGVLFALSWNIMTPVVALSAAALTFVSARLLSKTHSDQVKKTILFSAISIHLLLLIVFKVIETFFSPDPYLTGITEAVSTIPSVIGLSFFSLLNIGYLIDVYTGRIEAETRFLVYAPFSFFFPALFSGPIERSNSLLPQMRTVSSPNYTDYVFAARLFLWGLFKKMIIAEHAGLAVNDVFRNYTGFNSSTLLLTAVLYSIQIYADFSGYTDMALATARVLGIRLSPNFRFPYFSVSITEFWRKWHITLSSWLRDYLFMPLSLYFRSLGKMSVPVAVLVTFFISGVWHGIGSTFLVWGFLHGFYLATEAVVLPLVQKSAVFQSRAITFLRSLLTFALVTFAWIFFRAENINQATDFIAHIFTPSLFTFPDQILKPGFYAAFLLFFVIEYKVGTEEEPFSVLLRNKPLLIRWAVYYIVILSIIFFGGVDNDFIYFRF